MKRLVYFLVIIFNCCYSVASNYFVHSPKEDKLNYIAEIMSYEPSDLNDGFVIPKYFLSDNERSTDMSLDSLLKKADVRPIDLMSWGGKDSIFTGCNNQIVIDTQFVREYLNPFKNLVVDRIATQHYYMPYDNYSILAIIQTPEGHFLLYYRWYFSYYDVFISNISNNKPFPKTLMILSGYSDEYLHTYYDYDSASNVITITSVDEFNRSKVVKQYRLNNEFTELSTTQYFSNESDADSKSAPDIDTPTWVKDTITAETHRDTTENIQMSSIMTIGIDSLQIDYLKRACHGMPVSTKWVTQHLNPFINLTERQLNLESIDLLNYSILGKFTHNSNTYIIYSRQSSMIEEIYLACVSVEGSYPVTLMLYRRDGDLEECTFEYDSSENKITITYIGRNLDGIDKTEETYLLEYRFPFSMKKFYANYNTDNSQKHDLRETHNWELQYIQIDE